MSRAGRFRAHALAAALAAVLALPGTALANGGGGEEMEALELQTARVLAQQAIAILRVRADQEEASMRVDAALESDDQDDVDLAFLEQADEAIDSGDLDGGVLLLDQALSRPLGAESGKELHASGREFTPAFGAQEVVAIVAGAALLGLGVLALAPWRRARRPAA